MENIVRLIFGYVVFNKTESAAPLLHAMGYDIIEKSNRCPPLCFARNTRRC